MDKEILKSINNTLKTLVKEQKAELSDTAQETEATKIALLLESNNGIVEAIQANKLDIEQFAQVVRDAIKDVAIEIPKIDAPSVNVTVPDIQLPTINVPESRIKVEIPEIKVPTPQVTVNVPKADAPIVNVAPAEVNFPDKIDVGLEQFTPKSPLPVISVDPAGNFVAPMLGDGGGSRRVKISNTSSEPVPISGTISATFSADFGSGEIGSQTLRTVQATNAVSSVYITGANATIGVVTINPDGNPVYGGTSSGGGLTDTELRASAVPVSQVSGANWSTNVTNTVTVTNLTASLLKVDGSDVIQTVDGTVAVSGITASVAASLINSDGSTIDPRNRNWTITETVPISAGATLDVQQVSGTSWSTNVLSMPAITVTSITNTTASNIVDSTGVAYSGSNPVPISGAVTQSGTWNINTVTSITNTLAAMNVDSTGVGYSGSNPLPVTIVTNQVASTASALIDSTGVQYSGSNPAPVYDGPRATSGFAPTNATSTAYERNRVAKASAGILYGISGYNSSTAAQFILVHDAASQPADGTAAAVVIRVPASSNFSYDPGRLGRFFSTGITVTNSTTSPTKTVGYADCFFDIQYG